MGKSSRIGVCGIAERIDADVDGRSFETKGESMRTETNIPLRDSPIPIPIWQFVLESIAATGIDENVGSHETAENQRPVRKQ
jgi:hypothetical protein